MAALEDSAEAANEHRLCLKLGQLQSLGDSIRETARILEQRLDEERWESKLAEAS